MGRVVGFTGTRDGMTDEQKAMVYQLLKMWKVGATTFHHGDCIGADAEAHELAVRLGYRVEIHPGHPTSNIADRSLSARCKGDHRHESKPFLVRNRDIVHSSEYMIAAPKDARSRFRGSGTWYTARYAAEQGRPVFVVQADGTSTHYGKGGKRF